jgi:hypothetical protein
MEDSFSVSDPYGSWYGAGSSILGQYGFRSGSGFESRVFHDQNERKVKILFPVTNCYKRHCLRTPRLKWKPSDHLQNGQCSFYLRISVLFSFLDTILTILDPDLYYQYGSGSKGSHFNSDPHGSGYETLKETTVRKNKRRCIITVSISQTFLS